MRDDEAPTSRIASSKVVDPLAWFAGRGMSEPAAIAWFRTQVSPSYEHRSNISLETRVGSPPEDALYIEPSDHEIYNSTRGMLLVMRGGKPVVVLDVGLNTVGYDDPDIRWLDLALVVQPDGVTAELRDRALDGTQLIESTSVRQEIDNTLRECEKHLALGDADHDGGNGLAATWQIESINGKRTCKLARYGVYGYFPATLHDCAGALTNFAASTPDPADTSGYSAWKKSQATIKKSCAQRGKWVWRKGRFVQEK